MSGPVVTQADRDLWDELLYIWRMEFAPDGHRAIARHREASVAAAVAERDAQIAGLEAKCDALAGALGKIGTTYKGNNARLIHSETQIRDIARAELAKHKGKNDA